MQDERIQQAIDLLKTMFKQKQNTWPDDMTITVKVGQIKEAINLLGGMLELEDNSVGARKKDA